MTPALAAALALAAGALLGGTGVWVWMARRLAEAEDRLRTVTDGLEDMVQTMDQMHARLQARAGKSGAR